MRTFFFNDLPCSYCSHWLIMNVFKDHAHLQTDVLELHSWGGWSYLMVPGIATPIWVAPSSLPWTDIQSTLCQTQLGVGDTKVREEIRWVLQFHGASALPWCTKRGCVWREFRTVVQLTERLSAFYHHHVLLILSPVTDKIPPPKDQVESNWSLKYL